MFNSSSIARRAGKGLVALMLLVAWAMPAEAASVSVGRIGVGGTGCPAGSATARVSADGSQLTIRFSQFQVSAGGATSFDRKACGLAIPVRVPAGYSVALVGLDYNGTVKLPSGASATISVETFFAGGEGPKATKTIRGPKNSRFSYSGTGVAAKWSSCGTGTNLRVNTSLKVETKGASARASIRSQEIDGALIYALKLKRC